MLRHWSPAGAARGFCDGELLVLESERRAEVDDVSMAGVSSVSTRQLPFGSFDERVGLFMASYLISHEVHWTSNFVVSMRQ